MTRKYAGMTIGAILMVTLGGCASVVSQEDFDKLKSDVAAAQAAADDAKGTATEANTTAGEADAKADEALRIANEAKQDAAEAKAAVDSMSDKTERMFKKRMGK